MEFPDRSLEHTGFYDAIPQKPYSSLPQAQIQPTHGFRGLPELIRQHGGRANSGEVLRHVRRVDSIQGESTCSAISVR